MLFYIFRENITMFPVVYSLCIHSLGFWNLFYRLKTVIEELMQTQQTLLSKEKLVLELEKKIEESSKTCEKKSE